MSLSTVSITLNAVTLYSGLPSSDVRYPIAVGMLVVNVCLMMYFLLSLIIHFGRIVMKLIQAKLAKRTNSNNEEATRMVNVEVGAGLQGVSCDQVITSIGNDGSENDELQQLRLEVAQLRHENQEFRQRMSDSSAYYHVDETTSSASHISVDQIDVTMQLYK